MLADRSAQQLLVRVNTRREIERESPHSPTNNLTMFTVCSSIKKQANMLCMGTSTAFHGINAIMIYDYLCS